MKTSYFLSLMSRFNSFFLIHKGLKAMLLKTSLELQRTDFTKPRKVARLLTKLESVLDFLDGHLRQEETFIFSLLDAIDMRYHKEIEKDHVMETELNIRMRNLISVGKTARKEELEELGEKISAAWYEYVFFNIRHIAKENDIVKEALWAHHTDHQLMSATLDLMASLPRGVLIRNAIWMIRGNSISEMMAWLRMVLGNYLRPMAGIFLGIRNTPNASVTPKRS